MHTGIWSHLISFCGLKGGPCTLAPPQLTWALAVRALALIPLGLLAALAPAIAAARLSPLRHL